MTGVPLPGLGRRRRLAFGCSHIKHNWHDDATSMLSCRASSAFVRLTVIIGVTRCLSFTKVPSVQACPLLHELCKSHHPTNRLSTHLMARSSRSQRSQDVESTGDEVWIGVNRGQRTEFKNCQHCKRPMNRRARWKDDATWAAVKYCSDKCRSEAKRRPQSEGGVQPS